MYMYTRCVSAVKVYTADMCVCVCVCCRLRLVFGWLVTGFASHLDCRQLLCLWDRVIGFDSVDIIAGTCTCTCTYRCPPTTADIQCTVYILSHKKVYSYHWCNGTVISMLFPCKWSMQDWP